MKEDKIFYRAEEFNKFDWTQLIYGKHLTNGENFTFGKGGINHVNGSGWQLTVYSADDLAHETWELPRAISNMLDYQEKYGREANQREIQNAFGKILLGIE